MSTPLPGPHSTGTKRAPRFPTELHRNAAAAVADFFVSAPEVDTVLIVNSCARGVATPESDLDMAVLVRSQTSLAQIELLESSWKKYAAQQPVIREFRSSGAHSHLHLDIFDGCFSWSPWDEGGGPDSFEIEIGNRVAHAVPFYVPGSRFQQLQSQWLPYYHEDIRQKRLAMVHGACLHDLDHIPVLRKRGLHFHAFDRLYKAFQQFLQALFIACRRYPLAYNKWIREQLEDQLQLTELYRELTGILAVSNVESPDVENRAAALKALTARWIAPQLQPHKPTGS